MAEKEKLNLEQFDTTANEKNNTKEQLGDVLNQEYPRVVLSTPDETSPRIKTYKIDNSYFADKGLSRTEGTNIYSVQDLITIETEYYCSPDGRDHSNCIVKIDLFPEEKNIPEEYDNTLRDRYGKGQLDVLKHDDENKNIFMYTERNNLSSKTHYFRISPDNTVIFPGIETVKPCNGGYFHHIIIDEQSDYKKVDKKSIQETVNALFDQKKEIERISEYRSKNGDIGIELPWTEYSSGWYAPEVYMGDKHGIPAHEYSNEEWNTNKILVKFGNPGDCINFNRKGHWYSVYIYEGNEIRLEISTGCKWNDNQTWWHQDLRESSIQPGQIYINGEDVYENTMSTIAEQQRVKKDSRINNFNKLRDFLVNTYLFTESEFKNICKYVGKGKVVNFLFVVNSMLESGYIKKEDILRTMVDIAYPGDMVFRNYTLIKKKSDKFTHEYIKKIVDNGYARKYITDKLHGIRFVGHFQDVIGALKLSLEKGLFRKQTSKNFERKQQSTQSALGQALINAGIVNK